MPWAGSLPKSLIIRTMKNRESYTATGCSRARRILTRPRGVALLMVIWVLMLLSVIVTEFCYTMRTRVNITRNLKDSTRAYYVAVAGVNEAIAAVIKEQMGPGRNRGADAAADEESVAWRMNREMPPVPFGGGSYKVSIRNESGRIDINRAGSELWKAILKGFGLDAQERNVIVDSIMDWRDANDLHRPNGAEDDYYQSLDPPYNCKDGDFDTVDELLLVRGVTPELFHNGLAQLATVLPDAKTEDHDFDRININAAPEAMLKRLPGMSPELVEAVQEFRREADFRSRAQLVNVLGSSVYGKIARYITEDSLAYYTISAVGRVEGSKSRQGVEVLIAIDPEADKRYRIISWRDGIRENSGTRLPAGRN